MRSKERKARTSRRKLIACLVLGIVVVWMLSAALLLNDLVQIEQRIESESSQEPNNNDGNGQHDEALVDGAPLVIGIQHTVVVSLTTAEADFPERSTEIVYAISDKDDSPTIPQGIALLLHGCSHNALKFFSPSPSCPTCIGLSEEMRIARILLQEPSIAAVMAVTSQDRKSGCWSQKDVAHVQDALQYLKRNNRISSIIRNQKQQQQPLRIWAFGASSGGRFAAQLAVQAVVDAAMVGVMSLGSALTQNWKSSDDNNQQPPIYLAPMPRDKRTLKGTQEDYAAMTLDVSKNTARVILDKDTCTSFPVTASYLNERVPHMTLDMAKKIVTELKTSGHMDPTSGLLVKDPTKSDWRVVLQTTCGGGNDGCLQNQALGPGVSPLAKALHRAWAFHEYCSEVTLKALKFFQKKLVAVD